MSWLLMLEVAPKRARKSARRGSLSRNAANSVPLSKLLILISFLAPRWLPRRLLQRHQSKYWAGWRMIGPDPAARLGTHYYCATSRQAPENKKIPRWPKPGGG